MKLWIKTFSQEKIQLNELMDIVSPPDQDTLLRVLNDLKDNHDLPLPIVTQTNINNLLNFHHTKFIQRDFLETIDFDYLEISFIPK